MSTGFVPGIINVGVAEAALTGVQAGYKNNNMSDPTWQDVCESLQTMNGWLGEKHSMYNVFAIYENEVQNSLMAKAADPNEPFKLDIANAIKNLNSHYNKFLDGEGFKKMDDYTALMTELTFKKYSQLHTFT
jgi:hypothetical protein